MPLSVSSVKRLQRSDLSPFVAKLEGGSLPEDLRARERVETGGRDFVLRGGLLFRVTTDRVTGEVAHQVVVPRALRESVLRVYHDHSLAGHGQECGDRP